MNSLEAMYWPMYLQQMSLYYQSMQPQPPPFYSWWQAPAEQDRPPNEASASSSAHIKVEWREERPARPEMPDPKIEVVQIKKPAQKSNRRKRLLPLEKP